MLQLCSDVIEPFLQQLGEHPTFQFLCQSQNSFEGWLKWELAAFCKHKLLQHSKPHEQLMGVEVRLQLKPSLSLGNQKLVDFWIAENPAAPARYHYVELKVIFDNKNIGKMARAAGRDWSCLTAIVAKEKPASRGLLVLFLSAKTDDVEHLKHQIAVEKTPRSQLPPPSMTTFAALNATALYYERS